MPNLVTPPDGSPLTEQQIERAETLVAAHLGLDTLAETPRAQSGSVGGSGKIFLTFPAVSIQALTLGGAPAAGILATPFSIDVGSLGYGNPWGSPYGSQAFTVQYTSGWTADTLPTPIRQAVLFTAGALAAADTRRAGVTSERMGPVAVTYSDTFTTGTLPQDVRNLLGHWAPLRL